jgi:hypothetical protein
MTHETVDVLLDALLCADDAHSFHEAEIGCPDLNWARWYAEHMAGTLREDGYELVGLTANGSTVSP